MKCLNCGELMSNYLVQMEKDQISYDVCEKCGSLWLDPGELKKMAYGVEGDIEWCSRDEIEGAAATTRYCPHCSTSTLVKVSFIGNDQITLDRCNVCHGFWLDSGELDLVNRRLAEIMPIAGKGFSEFLNSVHLPYWYKRIRRSSDAPELKVETPPLAGATKQSTSEFSCPRCKSPLTIYKIHGIGTEGCPTCHGMWLDKDELRKLKDRSQKDNWRTLRWLDDEVDSIGKTKSVLSDLHCPKCRNQQLISTTIGNTGIIIDCCPSCSGNWVDAGEFQELVAYLNKKLNAMTASEVAREVRKEIAEIRTGPEHLVSELLDAKAAIMAFLTIKVYELPTLAKSLLKIPRI